ncbi:MAG TPA: TolC family protein, partial [Myxococcales bacterium]
MARILVVAALLCTAAVAQQRPQPLTLDEAVKLALQRNTDLQRQILLSLSAEQDRIIARSAVLPHADFNASIAANRQGAGTVVVSGVGFPQPTSNYSTTTVGLNVRQLIFDGGKWWNNISAANLALDASGAQVDEQRLQITYLVEQRFYELVRAQRQLQVFAEAATRSRDQANYTQRLFEGGRATQADVYAARANRDNDEVTRLGQERNVELA